MTRLEQIVKQIEQNKQPPVDVWASGQEVSGDIDIRIDVQGNWFHDGEPILREPLVALFASILWFENQQYYLVTPVEKLAITVEDVAYVVHQAEQLDDSWVAVTNTHEQLVIGPDHPVELRDYQGQWVPYIKVRYDLWARVNRSIYFQWVDMALDQQADQQADQEGALELSSQEYRFAVAKA